MKPPAFLTLAEVLEIHRDQIGRYGGGPGLRDLRLLESSVSMPQATFGGEFLHPSIFEMAAAYAFHISENQPFVDGNKRTGLASALIFLEMNGILVNDPRQTLYRAMMKVGNRQMTKTELAGVLEGLSRKK